MDEQSLNYFDEIKLLSDDKIESLCRIIRRPGGMIPGPNPCDAPVNNPGTPVNLCVENHLKLLAFFLRHQERVSRQFAAADIALDTTRAFRVLRGFELTYMPTDDPHATNAKDWPKTMESVHEYLCLYLGDCKIPLAYNAIPVNNLAGQYATVQDAMIASARHFTIEADGTRTINPVYLTNLEKVYDIIAKMTCDHPCWTYVKPAQRTRDGQTAYLGLYQHFLGPINVNNVSTMAKAKLKSPFMTVSSNAGTLSGT